MKQKRKRRRISTKQYERVNVKDVALSIKKRIVREREQFHHKKQVLQSLGYTILSNKETSKIDVKNKVINNKMLTSFYAIEMKFLQ